MPLPFFYKENLVASGIDVLLDEAGSRHIIQVLRMKKDEHLQLTDGKGNLFTVKIKDDDRKKCSVTILQTLKIQHPASNIIIAISPIKNNSRFEWFLEKATEIGVSQIVPILCERTEKQHFKYGRMNSILVSAMLQSQQVWLPVLKEPVKFTEYIKFVNEAVGVQKFIAHCQDEERKVQLTNQLINKESNQLILIGPEGDFTTKEIEAALKNNFTPVALGNTRLRTETAGVVAATLLSIC